VLLGINRIKPILVTGIIRSGTTFIGKVLATGLNTIYIHEPTNPMSPWNSCFPTPIAYYYINGTNGGAYTNLLTKLVNLDPVFQGEWREDIARNRMEYIQKYNNNDLIPRAIIKDPIALYSANWFKSLTIPVVIVLRHPISIIKSIVRLGWSKNYNPGFISRQPLLFNDFYRNCYSADEKIISSNWDNFDEVKRAICFVRLQYLAICKYYSSDENFIFISYEKFVKSPNENFIHLFKKLNLQTSEKTLNDINDSSEYDRSKAHQNSTTIINTLESSLLNDEFGVTNCRSILKNYFTDIYDILNEVVDWEF
jgi:hypothetical protein